MATTELRRRLLDYIDKADEKLLRKVEAVVQNHENDKIVAYTVERKSLNKEEFQQEIFEAEAEYKKGNFSTHIQIKEEVKTWKK